MGGVGEAFMLEWFGVFSGLLYLFLEIRQKSAMWIVGFISSLVYVFVFFSAKLYANASLNIYFVAMSIYGFWQWRKASNPSEEDDTIQFRKLSIQQIALLFIIALAILGFIIEILDRFTDSTFSFGDAFVTALSIVATWMVAKKYIEHWLVWIAVNLFSIYLYLHQHLYPTAALYVAYTLLSVYGYFKWKKAKQII